MNKIICDYIVRIEKLLLVYPENKLLESYLLQLQSLKNVPEAYLKEFDTVLPLVYEALEEVENIAENEVIFKLFSNMVQTAKISVLAENPNADLNLDDFINEVQ